MVIFDAESPVRAVGEYMAALVPFKNAAVKVCDAHSSSALLGPNRSSSL